MSIAAILGRSEGAEVVFRCEELGIDYPVFTTRPDTIFGTTSFVLAPEHPDVLRLMAEGRSNNGIAAQLFVTPKAVEKHIANIFGKLNLHADTAEHHRRVLAVLT